MPGFDELLGVVSDAIETSAGGYVRSNAFAGTVIRQGIAEGMSGSQILSAYRSAGGTIANQTFWALRGEIAASASAAGDTAGLIAGDPSAVVQIGGGRAGSYKVQLRAYSQTIDEHGEVVRKYQQFSLGQRDLDPTRALSDFTDIWNQNISDTEYGGQLLGMEVTGLYEYTGR
jgi:hypothetical protein